MKGSKSTTGLITILMIGAFVALLNNTLLNNALPVIMNDLEVRPATVQWLTTGFMLVNGIVMPTTAFLIQKYSARRLFLVAMGLFTIGTFIGGFSSHFSMLLIARMIQAVGSAIIMPLLMNVLLTSFPAEKRGSAMGIFGLVMIFAPAIGPTLSGWMIQHYHWSILFGMIAPIALVVFVLGVFTLHDDKESVEISIDRLSLIFSTIGFGGLLYGFSTAGNHGWNAPVVIGSMIIGLIFVIIFIRRQFHIQRPMLDFRIYRYPMFALSSAISMTLAISMFSAMLLLPMYLQSIRGFTPLASGLLMLPGAIVMGMMSPITGRIFDRYGAKFLAITGLSIVVITTYFFAQLTSTTPYVTMIGLYSLRMMGISMVMMPVMTSGLNSLPSKFHPHGTAMNSTLQQVSGAFGSSLLVSVMSNRAEFHTNKMINETMSQQGAASIHFDEWKRQIVMNATIEGMNDAFWVATAIAFLALVLAFFIRKSNTKAKEQPANQMSNAITKEVGSH